MTTPIELLCEDMLQTSAIDGEILDRFRAKSSLRSYLVDDPDSFA